MSAKKAVINNISQLLFQGSLTRPERRGQGRLSIVTFHRVLSEEDRHAYPFPDLAVTPEELDMFLNYFTEYFDCGTLASQHGRYLSGEVSSRPLLALTFDDAQHDNYSNARPVLTKHQVNASFFVPVSAVENQELLWHDRLGFAVLNLLRKTKSEQTQLTKILAAAGLTLKRPLNAVSNVVEASKRLNLEARLGLVKHLVEVSGTDKVPEFARLMTFDEISGLAADGHEIGSHSMTHCMMPECNDRTLLYETVNSRNILQERLGQAIESFCYPNGNSDARTIQAVSQAGYLRAVTTTWGSNGKEANRYQLRRFDMVSKRVQDSRGNLLPALLAFRMSGFYPGLG